MSDNPKWDELPDFFIDEDFDQWTIDEEEWFKPNPIVDKEYEDMFV